MLTLNKSVYIQFCGFVSFIFPVKNEGNYLNAMVNLEF